MVGWLLLIIGLLVYGILTKMKFFVAPVLEMP